MWKLFKHRDFLRLFVAQVVSLGGTGLLTVALGLLAFDLAGPAAGAVLGTAYAIKMLSYVGLSPITSALVSGLPRRAVLIAMDVLRMVVALCLPFVETIGEVFVLIFILQAASATFTPAFQAMIPDILVDEAKYTRALSLSRMAYDLENLLSPALAGLLLLVMNFQGLFVGTSVGFLISAILIWQVNVPSAANSTIRPFRERVMRGIWIYVNTPRLRGLLALNLGAAAVSAFVLVNTVVLVRVTYGLGEGALAIAMGCYGAGSFLVALSLPIILERLPDRTVMLIGSTTLGLTAVFYALWFGLRGPLGWEGFLAIWALLGAFYSMILTPSGRLLRQSAQVEDRPAVFTAQFALSHACWLLAYPLAGYVGTWLGLWVSMLLAGLIACFGTLLAVWIWRPANASVDHTHPYLSEDHPHLKAHGGRKHLHVYIIDDDHPSWPTS